MISCLIIEDEPLARNLMTEYVNKVPYLRLIKACSNPITALEILRNEPVDLLFLDIQMPELTGISLLKTLSNRPFVILTTAYSQYALEGYELDVVDYLLKPITFERFLKAVDKVSQRTNAAVAHSVVPKADAGGATSPTYVFVKDGTKLVKVFFDDILYVEGMKDYVTINTVNQKITTLQRLKVLEEQLPADKFFRIHHSFIVAIRAIDAVHKGEVTIGNRQIPISESYRKAFRDFIESRQMGG
jgi:two-component system, LytTR family, response regulator